MSGEDRRFTDREVALVLKRAAELEETRQSDLPGRGMTLGQLYEIAREVGLSHHLVDNAVAELRGQRHFDARSLLRKPSPLTKVVRAVPGRLDTQGKQRLMRLVEDSAVATGTISEALGSVRWTTTVDGQSFNHTTQVALTPSGNETQIQVTERLSPRLQTLLHLLPPVWGGMIGVAIAASGALALLPAIGVVGGCAVAGAAVGRGMWFRMVARSRARVERVAEELTREASLMAVADTGEEPV